MSAQQCGGDRDRVHAFKDEAFRADVEPNMDRGLYIAASGMLAEQVRQDQIANDLANGSTPGYKADRTTQQSFGELLLTNSVTGGTIGTATTAVQVTGVVTNFKPQALNDTGEPLDFAINGDGFFAVQTDAGTRYTRNGQFAPRRAGPADHRHRRSRPRAQRPPAHGRRRRQGRPAPAQRRPAHQPAEDRRQPRDRHARRRRRPRGRPGARRRARGLRRRCRRSRWWT